MLKRSQAWTLFGATLVGLAVTASPPATAGGPPAPLIDELGDIKSNEVLNPAGRAAALAEVYVSLGAGEPAREHAGKALALAPHSAYAAFVMVELLTLEGDEAGALELALAKWNDPELSFEAGMRGGLRHFILGLYFRRGEFAEAERFLLDEFPGMGTDFSAVAAGGEPNRRYPPHAAQALANIYRATGRATLAEAPTRYARDVQLALLPEAREEMRPADHWIAAAAEVGVAPASEILAELRRAFSQGFQLSWRFNYQYHPVFQPLWGVEDFGDMIAEFEADAARQRQMIGE